MSEASQQPDSSTPPENHTPSLEDILADGVERNKQWKKDHPPSSPKKSTLTAIKKQQEKMRVFGAKISRAREIYWNIYQQYKDSWNKTSFEIKLALVKKRLKAEGIKFSRTEEIALRTTLRTSSIKIWTTEEEVDAHDGPNNPARIADEARKAAAATAAEETPDDSQKAA